MAKPRRSKPGSGLAKTAQCDRNPSQSTPATQELPKSYPRATQGLPKGYPRATQGMPTGATPEQHRISSRSPAGCTMHDAHAALVQVAITMPSAALTEDDAERP